jgi:hypothetical protein
MIPLLEISEGVISQASAPKTSVYSDYGKPTIQCSLKIMLIIVATYSTIHIFCGSENGFQPNNVLPSHLAKMAFFSTTVIYLKSTQAIHLACNSLASCQSYQYIICLCNQGKSILKSTNDSLLPVTDTGTAGFTECNSTSVHLVHTTNHHDLLLQAHQNLPPPF